MFTCTACLRRSLKNLESDISRDTFSVLLQPKSSVAQILPSFTLHIGGNRHQCSSRKQYSPIHHRSHATLASLRKGHHRKQLQYLQKGSQAKNSPVSRERRKAPWALTKVELRDAVARDRNRTRLRTEQGEVEDVGAEEDEDVMRPSELPEPSQKKEAKTLMNRRMDRAAEQEAEKQERKLVRRDTRDIEVYYKDPLQLADGVLQRLKVPDIQGALRLVRASQAFDIKNIVSWNHCCDWLMAHGQYKQALSVYNEMKSRGQMPDAHTYTIMLRGLSQHVDRPSAVQEAIKIYNSIFAPNSTVKPNTIHTNAIINLCARAGDMDSMWAVAGRLPERGAGSPDRITFSTILNAIRENTIKEAAKSADRLKASKSERDWKEDVAADERSRLYTKAVEDGRKLWEDISYRWRRADLVLDEQLVCAMGRLLLVCGVGKDVEQVLDLVEVAMNLRLKERSKQSGQSSAWLQSPAGKKSDEASSLSRADSARNTATETANLPLKESNVYATPGRNTLSMLLEACSQLRSIQHLSTPYWRYLTDPEGPYKVEPDAANIMAYLRLLRMQRASSDAYQLLSRDWPADVGRVLYRRASFVIAFSTCLRDKNNPNVFKTATKMLKLADEKAEERAVGMYDDNMALGEMGYHKRKQALQTAKQELKNMTMEEKEEAARNQEGVQSLNVDPKILNYYLELAISTTQGWNEGLRGKDDGTVFERHPGTNRTMVALISMASRTNELKRLVKAKLDEIQNRDMPRRRRERALDPRAGTRVGEDFDDMLQLMKTMIGGWDKCLEVHERFQKAGKEGLDQKIMEGFLSRKREMTSYMARVEKSMGEKLRQRKELEAEARRADIEDADEEDEYTPDVERRIKDVLEGVNSELSDARRRDKGKDGRPTRRYGVPEDLKISSRRQERERDNLIENRMGKTFPKEDYGSLNSDLEVVSGRDAVRSRIDEQKRLSSQGFTRGLSARSGRRPFENRSANNSGIRRPKPVFGREGSPRFSMRESRQQDVQDRDTPSRRTSESRDWQKASSSRRAESSILDRHEVKQAWGRSAAAAA